MLRQSTASAIMMSGVARMIPGFMELTDTTGSTTFDRVVAGKVSRSIRSCRVFTVKFQIFTSPVADDCTPGCRYGMVVTITKIDILRMGAISAFSSDVHARVEKYLVACSHELSSHMLTRNFLRSSGRRSTNDQKNRNHQGR